VGGMTRRRLGIPMAGVALLLISMAGQSGAQPLSDDTTFTLNLQTGVLSITVTNATNTLTPNPVAPGDTATGAFGPVTVSDLRAAVGDAADWTATVGFPQGGDCPRDPTTCSFINSATPTPATIPDTAVSYVSGPPTSTTGDGTFTAGGTFVLSPSGTAFTRDVTAPAGGNSTATWSPTLSVAVPDNATDTSPYTAIIRHSVA
jgi:hypothetical protein